MVDLKAIQQAHKALQNRVRHTPLLFSDTFTHRLGYPVYLKAENLQRTGSFKIRGAFTKLAQLTDAPRAAGVITASAGNHGQAVALAAQLRDVPATVVMPESASLAKYQATLGYGASVIRHGATYDDALAHAQALAREHGLIFISGFDDEAVVTGQGTLGLELLEDLPDVQQVVVPVGGGGLIAGIATAIKAVAPQVRVVGVQAQAAPAAYRSFRSGRRLLVRPKPTIADGVAIGQPGRIPLHLMRRYVDDMVTVDEEAISHALVLLLERTKLLVEPAGAVGIAALLSGKIAADGKTTVAVLSGGNVDVALLDRLVEHGLSLAGRYLTLRVRLPDRPGQLARLLDHLAELRVNVREVEHHRAGVSLPVGQVEVRLVLETHNEAHGEQVRATLRSLAYVL